jgi:hypothetical protein
MTIQQLTEPNPRSGLRTAGDPLPNRKGTPITKPPHCYQCGKEAVWEQWREVWFCKEHGILSEDNTIESILRVNINDLNKKESAATEQRKVVSTIWFDCIRERYNLTEGTAVRYAKKQYRVCEITIAFDWSTERKPHCKGNPWNKEMGKYGLSERMLFDQWEVVGE